MDCVPLVLGHDLDPLADLLFAFAMSHVLFEIYADLDDAGCLQLPEEMPVGTTWADDTCILLAGEASTIDSRLASSFSIVHQALLRHGLSPSYGPGKTAAVLNYRGRDSARYHRRRFASATPSIPCLVEHGESIELAVTYTYKHLGSLVDGDSPLPEVRTRSALALQAIKPISKSCLANPQLSLKRRQQILASLGVSVLCHNVGTWRRLNEQEYSAWSSGLWKIYNCMYNNSPNADFTKRTIEQVSLQAGSFTPDALLHVCRLRLYVNLLRSPDDLLPGAIHDNYLACGSCGEKAWFGCVRNALDWLVATVGLFPEAQGLRDLQPQELFQAHVGLADGLHRALRSALKAHLLHLQMLVDLTETHDKISLTLSQAGWSCPQAGGEKLQHLKYRCPDCKATFRGEAHLATHRQRTHGTLVAARSFVLNSCCPACKKDFHTRPRAIKHVQYQSTKCLPCCWRTELLFQRILRDPLMPKMLRILELNVDQAYVLAAHACQLTLLDHSLLQLLNQPHGYHHDRLNYVAMILLAWSSISSWTNGLPTMQGRGLLCRWFGVFSLRSSRMHTKIALYPHWNPSRVKCAI